MNALTPRPAQNAALNALTDALAESDRAQIEMACGTGKTLVGRWLAERRSAQTTLVVVPSLALIAQTLAEWRAAGGSWQFDAAIICSDPTTADGARELAGSDGENIPEPFWTTHRAPVTTSVRRASAVLSRRQAERPLVVFATYHSAHVAAAAAQATDTRFDLVVADEAHNLAGHPRKEFRVVLDEDVLPAAARVFMTATRVTTSIAQDERNDWTPPLSMDDHATFGPLAYRLDFAEAIRTGLLSDYRIAIFETPGESAPDPVAALAAAAARGLRCVLSFHGRVAKAQAFAQAVDGLELPDGRRVVARAVAGADPAVHRAGALRLLETADPATLVVISSARCLTEGVDIPAVDGILFADPKNSDVDVIQAVGRALRRAPGKAHGHILIPVCYDPNLDEDTTLSTSSFAAVWRILRGLRTLDSTLATELTELRRRASTSRPIPRACTSRISFDVPSAAALSELVVRLVDATSPAWDGFFADLEAYTARHGTSIPPAGHRLHAWCERQRRAHRRGMLPQPRAAALRSLPGWAWDLNQQRWDEQWAHVFAAAGRRLRLDDLSMMNAPIPHRAPRIGVNTVGSWCAQQRILGRRGDLDPTRRTRLESIPGWTWTALNLIDTTCVDLLGEYVAWKHDANAPADYVEDDQPVGAWLHSVRRRRALDTLEQPLLDELQVLTPPPSAAGALRWERKETQWKIGLTALRQFVAREGRCRPPELHVELLRDGQLALSAWCRRQRQDHRYGRLRADRVAALEAVEGWRWEIQPSPRTSMDVGDARHGTRTGYVKGCRCRPCTEANRNAHRAREVRARQGGPSTDLVPASRSRGQLRILEGQGAARKALARAADLNVKTIVEILDGSKARIQPDTERTILALTIQQVRAANAPGTVVSAAATWELVDDIVRRGWSKAWIARELGVGPALQLGSSQITAGNAARIEALHRRLSGMHAPQRARRSSLPTLDELLAAQSA
jgi:superfamily II DNA or RNA helicase